MIRQLKLLFGAIGVAALCALSAYVTYTLTRPPTVSFLDTAAVLREVQQLNELVSVKYVIEKVVGVTDTTALGEDRLLLIAHGIVKAGVRLDELTAEDVLRGEGGSVTLRLPPSRILDVYLDEKKTQVYERTTGLLRRFNKDLEKTARDHAVDSIRLAARDLGIEEEARQRAERNVERLLLALGFQKVNFVPRS